MELMARGDRAFAERGRGHQGDRAAPGPIAEAVEAYEAALAHDGESLALHWKLLRALFFQGDYATPDPEMRRSIFERGCEVFASAMSLLGRRVGVVDLEERSPEEVAEVLREVPEAGRIYFWGSIHWGLWGQTNGAMAALRQGVARRVRDYAELARTLDPDYEDGGGHRLLGRLHSEAPKVPLFTGWVSRKVAVEALEEAWKLAPEDNFNRLYLAEALLDFRPKRRPQAVELLNQVLSTPPRPDRLVEEERARLAARSLLDSLAGPK